jgi:hypothetical protein
VLWHHVTAAEALAELARAGCRDGAEMYGSDGERLSPTDDTAGTPWLYLLAPKAQ